MNAQYWRSTGDSMSNERDSELKKAETWDFEKPEVREPVKYSRAVVSVAFRRDDFTQVSEFAGRIGKRTSEFIREAAIEKATGQGAWTVVYGSGSAGSLWWAGQIPTNTLASGSQVEYPEEALVATY
jgi:hypothetical protein